MKIPKPSRESLAFFESVLPPDSGVKRRQMFGNPAVFVNSNLFAGLYGDALFVRPSPEDKRRLLEEEGGSVFEPMAGRRMSNYVVLPKSWTRDPEDVRRWVMRSFEWSAKLPPKK